MDENYFEWIVGWGWPSRTAVAIPMYKKDLDFVAIFFLLHHFFFFDLGRCKDACRGNPRWFSMDWYSSKVPLSSQSTLIFLLSLDLIKGRGRNERFLHNIKTWFFTTFLLPFAFFFQFYFSSSHRKPYRGNWFKLLHMVSTFPQSWSWGFGLLRLLCADLQNLFVVWVLAEDKTMQPDGWVHGSPSPQVGSSSCKHCVPIASTVGSPPTK